MSENDVDTYSGLRLIPAALALLDLEHDGVARAVTVEPVERRSRSGAWTEDEVTIDLTRLEDGRRSSTALRTAFARSMLDGSPVEMRALDHFGHGTFAHFMRALAVAWPDPPPSIEELLAGGEWRELGGDEFRRRPRGDDPDDPGAP